MNVETAEVIDDRCPRCDGNLDGGPIPERVAHHYPPGQRWSIRIGIYCRWADRTIAWRCPFCQHEWGRAGE